MKLKFSLPSVAFAGMRLFFLTQKVAHFLTFLLSSQVGTKLFKANRQYTKIFVRIQDNIFHINRDCTEVQAHRLGTLSTSNSPREREKTLKRSAYLSLRKLQGSLVSTGLEKLHETFLVRCRARDVAD
jgi:hypothetical protein